MWFNEPPDRRIISWRDWRNSLNGLDSDSVVEKICKDWSRVPTVLHYLSPDQIADWPNPWELVYNNVYCDLAICLGMTYTLCLLESPTFTDIELKIYRTESGWTNLSLINQGKYVLNYHYGRVVNSQCVSEDKMKLAYSYSKFDLLDKFS
jgi:hypothetical protein